MQNLGNLLTRSLTEVPDLTEEQWAEQNRLSEQWEERQRLEKVASRIENAGIPQRYRMPIEADSKVTRWAENPTVGLLIQGMVGRGKTHQACMALMKQAERGTALFATFDDLLRECRATFNNRTTEESVISRYASVGMLCIDDMGKERVTEWSLPILFAIVDKRYANLKPTIVTTQYSGEQLLQRLTVDDDSETARAIISRMTAYDRVTIEGKDWRRD